MPQSPGFNSALLIDLFDRTPGLLAVTDLQGRILAVNPAWSTTFGRAPQAFPGTLLPTLAFEVDRPPVEALMQAAAAGDEAQGQHRFSHPDGSWRALAWRAHRTPRTDILHVAATDVTATVRRQAAAEAERDAVTRGIAHDLRAPLRAVDGFAGILLADTSGLTESARRAVEMLRDASAEVRDMLDGITELTRVTTAPLERIPIDVAALAREVVALRLRPRQGDREVHWRIGPTPPCRADAVLVRVLLAMLLDNALRFTPADRPAHIDVGFDEAAGAYFVRDDGCGFDLERVDTAMAIFGRLGGGSGPRRAGMGLPVAQRIVARHGGRLWADSAPGAGATFWFVVEPGG